MQKVKTKDLLEALKRRHPEERGEWASLEEAFRIDLLTFGCWQGHEPHYRRIAYELKVSRADFQRELKNPWKSSTAKAIADFFYFVAPAGLIKPEEVPEDCGLLCLLPSGRWKTLVSAPWLEPRELTRDEVAYLMRYRMVPGRLRHALQQAEAQKHWSEVLQEHVEEAREGRRRAWGKLELLLRDKVTIGSKWMGSYPDWRSGSRTTTGTVTHFVGEHAVSLSVEDSYPRSHFCEIGELLTDFELVAG